MGTSEGVRGPQTTDCSRPNVVCRDCFPVSSLSPTRHRNTGQASLGSDLDFLCPEWVPVLPGFPAGDSAATPVLGLVGSPGWGSGLPGAGCGTRSATEEPLSCLQNRHLVAYRHCQLVLERPTPAWEG